MVLRVEVKTIDSLRNEEAYTIEDIYALPDGERAELINGKIYYMAPPNTKHQRLVSDLHYQIKDFINKIMVSAKYFHLRLRYSWMKMIEIMLNRISLLSVTKIRLRIKGVMAHQIG